MTELPWHPIESSADLLSRVTLQETSESVTLEFKLKLQGPGIPNHKQRECAQKELCRDICQFANTFGGTLLFGVEEGQVDGRSVAIEYHRVDDIATVQQWILQAVRKYVVPATIRLEFRSLAVKDGEILAVNVPPSENLITLWDQENGTIESLRRTDHGKEYMNPDELQRHLMDTGRRGMLALRRLHARLGCDAVSLMSGVFEAPMTKHNPSTRLRRLSWPVCLGLMHDDEFELRIPNLSAGMPTVTVPYGLIRQVWTTADGKVGILLDARIVFYGGRAPILKPT